MSMYDSVYYVDMLKKLEDGKSEKRKDAPEQKPLTFEEQNRILREALSVCEKDYNSMLRLLKGLDNLCAIECVNRMETRKPLFKQALEKVRKE